jgi:hypothetical protein
MKKVSILLMAMLIIAAMPMLSFADEAQFTKAEFLKGVLETAEIQIEELADSESLDVIDKEYAPYLKAAYDRNIISKDIEFNAKDAITKEEAAIILVNVFGERVKVKSITEDTINKELQFSDNAHIKSKQYITYALKNDLIKENSKCFYAVMPLTKDMSKKMIAHAKKAHDEHFVRDGLEAEEILVLANKKLEEEKTYKAKGNMNMDMRVNVEGLPAEDESAKTLMEQGMNMNMLIDFDIQAQNPDKVYMKQVTVSKSDMNELESEENGEVYMDGAMMYQKNSLSGDKWIKNDMSSVFSKIQSLQGNNIQNMTQLTDQQLKFFKDYAGFGEDVKKDGKEYYVITLDLDKEAYKKFYEDYTKEIIDASINASLEQKSDGKDLQLEEQAEIEMAKQFVSQMINDMDMEISYSFYIDKKTKCYESMDMNVSMYMNMDRIVQMMAQMSEEDTDISNIKMEMVTNMKGQFKYSDFGKEVVFPEITKDDIFNMEDAALPQN